MSLQCTRLTSTVRVSYSVFPADLSCIGRWVEGEGGEWGVRGRGREREGDEEGEERGREEGKARRRGRGRERGMERGKGEREGRGKGEGWRWER